MSPACGDGVPKSRHCEANLAPILHKSPNLGCQTLVLPLPGPQNSRIDLRRPTQFWNSYCTKYCKVSQQPRPIKPRPCRQSPMRVRFSTASNPVESAQVCPGQTSMLVQHGCHQASERASNPPQRLGFPLASRPHAIVRQKNCFLQHLLFENITKPAYTLPVHPYAPDLDTASTNCELSEFLLTEQTSNYLMHVTTGLCNE
jgi:hypothetical protein